MSATEFNVDLRDIHFVLFEQLRIQDGLAGSPQFEEFDKDFYTSILDEIARISKEVVAPINGPGDREGCRLEGGQVFTPKGYKGAHDVIVEGGWLGIQAEQEHGGLGLPAVIGTSYNEIRTGASLALSIYHGLTQGVANLLVEFGDDWMKQVLVPKLYSGDWAGTMLLTEAGAGTAVGENRCKATPTDQEGVYELEGEKVFISGGDQDLTENIIHVVLARTPDAPAGTRGLSIFMVPKFVVKEDGSLGDRNDIVVQGIEEKMGIHGSATCTMTLGASGKCVGWRIGEENAGIKIMFHLMNEARIMVGVQGLATAAPAYLNALAYAQERLQGPDIREMRDPDAPQVPIVEHPDVRRMLMIMRVLVDTMRSFLYDSVYRYDLARVSDDPAEQELQLGLLELYTPICKAHCSDLGFEVNRLAVQVLGGYGYIQEYPVEQYLRDNKISSIYEGTNGIQAMDLLGRKMQMKNGTLFMQWLQHTTMELAGARGKGFDDDVQALEKARNSLGASAMHLAGLAMGGKVREAMLQASPFLTQFGTVLLGIHALRQAIVAREAKESSPGDAGFYTGKELNLKFYVSTILPQAEACAMAIQSGDASCLDGALFATT